MIKMVAIRTHARRVSLTTSSRQDTSQCKPYSTTARVPAAAEAREANHTPCLR